MARPAPAPEDPLVALTTAPDPGIAEDLARRLVEARFAACVQLVPGVISAFRWEGRVERAGEVLLLIKTVGGRLRDLEAFLAEHHPYDVPELMVFAADHVGAAYLAWLHSESAALPPGAPS
jgi:periplasmic divalent cation tolerance protein